MLFSQQIADDVIKNSATRERYYFVDVLNIVSSFAVVALHVSLGVFSPSVDVSWVESVAFQAAAIFAVPVFFMVSGMNLLGYRERYSTTHFFLNRFRRVGVSLLAGSLLFYFVYSTFPAYFYSANLIASSSGVIDFVIRLLGNKINDIYWFLYAILYLYLVTPLFSLAIDDRRLMRYLICLSCFASVIVPFCKTFLPIDDLGINQLFLLTRFNSICAFYYLLGGYIGKYRTFLDDISAPLCAVGYFVCTCAMIIWGLISNGYFSGCVTEGYRSYPISISSPLCVAQSLLLLHLLKKEETKLRALPVEVHSVIKKLSGAAIYVYLIHILLVNLQPVGKMALVHRIINYSPGIKLILVYLISAAVGVFVLDMRKRLFALKIKRCDNQNQPNE